MLVPGDNVYRVAAFVYTEKEENKEERSIKCCLIDNKGKANDPFMATSYAGTYNRHTDLRSQQKADANSWEQRGKERAPPEVHFF